MTTAKDVMKLIKDNEVKYQDFRFADPRGKWRHVTFDISMVEEETFSEGQMFDGSSIAGWKAPASRRVRDVLLRMTLRSTRRVAGISYLAPRRRELSISTAIVAPTGWGRRGLG
jgi:glutamine synthetase